MSHPLELDVSHYHAEGREPFADIMAAAGRVDPGDALMLVNTFEPVPLYGVMAEQGFTHAARQEGPERWVITFTRTARPAGRP